MSPRGSVKAKIMEALRIGARTKPDIKLMAGTYMGAVEYHIFHFLRKGIVRQTGRTYRLARTGRPCQDYVLAGKK